MQIRLLIFEIDNNSAPEPHQLYAFYSPFLHLDPDKGGGIPLKINLF